MRRIVGADAVSALIASALGYLVRFGPAGGDGESVSLGVALTLPLVWLAAMLVARSYEERFLWVGADEFRRVLFDAALLLATVGTV